jgi:hypothetical protein
LEKRKCAMCLIEKLLNNFYYHKKTKSYYIRCKNCFIKRQLATRLSKRYNTNLKEVKKLLKIQQSKCLICNCCIKKKYSIDHNHKTHIVRGLLCNNCNAGLGMFKDNPKILKSAILYLKEKGHYGTINF